MDMLKTGEPLLSIIVPVYMVEDYVQECVQSILRQKYKNFELILVNDGSPDASLSIIESLAKEDSRIHVISKKNGGLSSARNAGIDIAIGKYLAFVDSDDLIHPDFYKAIIDEMEDSQSDIGECKYIKFIDENNIEILNGSLDKSRKTVKFSNQQALFNEFIFNKHQCIAGVIWNKVYKRDIFEHPSMLRFKDRIKAEDGEIILKILSRCDKYIFVNQEYYFYRTRNDGNITSNRGMNLDLRLGAIDALITQFNIMTARGYEPKQMGPFLWRISTVLINSYFIIDKKIKRKDLSTSLHLQFLPVISAAIFGQESAIRRLALRLFLFNREAFWLLFGKWYSIYYSYCQRAKD